MSDKKCYDLSERVAVVEERMNTMKAELSDTLNAFRADFANFKTDMADRQKANTRWIIGVIIAVAGLGLALTRFGWPV